MKWISTKEQLPEVGQLVCVVMRGKDVIKLGQRCIPWPSTQEIYWKVETIGYLAEAHDKIAYWCALPDIPSNKHTDE